MAVPQKSSRGRVVAVFVGLLIAAAGLGGTLYLARQSSTPSGGGGGGATVNVVVALQDIPQGTKITPDLLTTASYSTSQLPAVYFTDPTLVNGFTAVPVSKNEVIVPALIAPSATSTARTAPLKIADGDVAMAIPDDALKGAGGYIQTGDRIDVLVDVGNNGSVKYVFQDVLVLRVGSASTAATGGVADLLLVELPRRQAEQLGAILTGKSNLVVVRYVLRPYDQYGKGYLASGSDTPTTTPVSDTPVNAGQLSQLFGH